MPSSENNIEKNLFAFTENPGHWFSFPGDLVDFQESPGECRRHNMYDLKEYSQKREFIRIPPRTDINYVLIPIENILWYIIMA